MIDKTEIAFCFDFTKTHRVLIVGKRLALYFPPPFSRIRKLCYRLIGIGGWGAIPFLAAEGHEISIDDGGLRIEEAKRTGGDHE